MDLHVFDIFIHTSDFVILAGINLLNFAESVLEGKRLLFIVSHGSLPDCPMSSHLLASYWLMRSLAPCGDFK